MDGTMVGCLVRPHGYHLTIHLLGNGEQPGVVGIRGDSGFQAKVRETCGG